MSRVRSRSRTGGNDRRSRWEERQGRVRRGLAPETPVTPFACRQRLGQRFQLLDVCGSQRLCGSQNRWTLSRKPHQELQVTLKVSARDESPSSSPGSGSQRPDFSLGSVLASRRRHSIWRVAEPAVPGVGGRPCSSSRVLTGSGTCRGPCRGRQPCRSTAMRPSLAQCPQPARSCPGSCRSRCQYWAMVSLKTRIESVTQCP